MEAIATGEVAADARVVTHGELSSLYHTLDDEVVARLEEAILCCYLRDFESALAIFDGFASDLQRHPVIAYQHAQFYWMQWEHFKCAKILGQALDSTDLFHSQFLNTQVYTLLRIFLGTSNYYTNGDLTLARDEMREIKSSLSTVPMECYTDVQTQCLIRFYYVLILLQNVTTDFDIDFFRTIPLRCEETAGSALTQFRDCLQKRGQLKEARFIMDAEVVFSTNIDDQLHACESFLEACSKGPTHEPIWFIAGKARMRLAHVLHVNGRFEEATRELASAKRCLMPPSDGSRRNGNELLIQLQKLKDNNSTAQNGLYVNDADLLRQYQMFVDNELVRKDTFVFSTALSRGIDVALTIYEADSSVYNEDVFWQWSLRMESLLEKIGDIAQLYIDRHATGDIVCMQSGDYGSLIKWHETFDNKFLTFNLWRQKISAKKRLTLVYTHITDEEQAMRTVNEMKEITNDQDVFWSEEGFKLQSEIASINLSSRDDKKPMPIAFQNDAQKLDWTFYATKSLPAGILGTWDDHQIMVGTNNIEISIETEQLLLKYMRDDLNSGLLNLDDLEVLIGRRLQDNDDNASMRRLHCSACLDVMTPKELSIALYGTATSPRSVSEWDKIFGLLKSWLLDKSAQSVIKRHYLLFQLQDKRQSKPFHYIKAHEIQAIESQRLIDLVPFLNETVQRPLESCMSGWRNQVALAKTSIYYQKNDRPFLDPSVPELQEIINLYNQSIKESHGTGHLLRRLQTYVSIAQLYFHAALALNQQALDPFFNALANALTGLEKIREGWRSLRGWQRLQNLTLALLEPSIRNIVPWAVAVLCQYSDTVIDFRDNMVWAMVQEAKSVGLGWLMEINAQIAEEMTIKAATASTQNSKIQKQSDLTSDRESHPSKTKAETPLDQEIGNALTIQHDVDDVVPQLSHNARHSERRQNETTSTRPELIADSNVSSYEKQTSRIAEEAAAEDSNKELKAMHAKLKTLSIIGGNVVFVDWYDGTSSLRSFLKPLLVILSPGENPRCRLVDITWNNVNKAVEKFASMDSEDLKNKEASRVLDKLSPLVEPLKELSKPGQTLVFSPWGNLHRVPLHALKIDGQTLIKRNPVVYCSSLGALITAFDNRQHENANTNSSTFGSGVVPLKGAIFGDPPSEVGSRAVQSTISKFHMPSVNTGDDFKADSFVQSVQDPNLQLVHYHGHANFSSSSPIDQSLLFNDRPLTLRQIFDIPPGRRAFHVTLLGCGSGATKTVATNDVIGLVPSLFHAGAASTVSSLWTFSDADAALYSKYFYEPNDDGRRVPTRELVEDTGKTGIEDDYASLKRKQGEQMLWNLAIANQRAVLKIMEQKPALYHWAGFVLHGWWMMGVPR